MRMRMVAALIAVLALPAATLAQPAPPQASGAASSKARFHDAATGLMLDLPAPYVVTGRQDRPNYDIAVAVRSTTGAPKAAAPEGGLCGVAYVRAPANQGLTQGEINARVSGQAWLDMAKKPLAMLGAVERAEVFAQPGAPGTEAVRGGEFLIAPTSGPEQGTVKLYIAMWETPRGRVVVTCSGYAAEMPAALDAFRTIRRAASAG